MDWHEKGVLQGITYDATGGHMHGGEQESVKSSHRWAADAWNGVVWAIKKIVRSSVKDFGQKFVILFYGETGWWCEYLISTKPCFSISLEILLIVCETQMVVKHWNSTGQCCEQAKCAKSDIINTLITT